MTGRDLRVTGRPVRQYGVLDYAREELRERPMTLHEAAGILLGFLLVVCLLVLFLTTGEAA